MRWRIGKEFRCHNLLDFQSYWYIIEGHVQPVVSDVQGAINISRNESNLRVYLVEIVKPRGNLNYSHPSYHEWKRLSKSHSSSQRYFPFLHIGVLIFVTSRQELVTAWQSSTVSKVLGLVQQWRKYVLCDIGPHGANAQGQYLCNDHITNKCSSNVIPCWKSTRHALWQCHVHICPMSMSIGQMLDSHAGFESRKTIFGNFKPCKTRLKSLA